MNISTLFLSLALSFSTHSPNAERLNIGEKAPLLQHSLKDVSGKVTRLNDEMGSKGLLVIFSSNTCPFVIATQDRYRLIAKLCKANGIGMVAINSNEAQRNDVDSFEEMKAYARDQEYTFPYLLDENHQLADAFGATKTPDVFLFDSQFILKYRGAIDNSHRDASNITEHYLENALKSLVKGSPIQPESTASIGCSIKRNKP
jgi:peroxiredoxin